MRVMASVLAAKLSRPLNGVSPASSTPVMSSLSYGALCDAMKSSTPLFSRIVDCGSDLTFVYQADRLWLNRSKRKTRVPASFKEGVAGPRVFGLAWRGSTEG